MAGMNDDELGEYLAPRHSAEDRAKLVAALNPDQRKLFDAMRGLEGDIALWQAGLAPKPNYAIICGANEIREGRGPKRRARK